MENTAILTYTASSHVGSRSENQDNFRLNSEKPFFNMPEYCEFSGEYTGEGLQVFGVCDGMGGEAMGEVASMSALDSLERSLQELSEEEKNTLPLEEILLRGMQLGQKDLRGFYQLIRRTGGTTITLLAVRGKEYHVMNLGDSPAFLLREGILKELSVQHSMALYKKEMELPVQEGDQHILLRFLGMAEGDIETLVSHVGGTLQDGDCFLLCSDGIPKGCKLLEIRQMLEEGADADALVQKAIQVEYADNCTAIVIRWKEKEEEAEHEGESTV